MDYVFHEAALASVPRSVDNPVATNSAKRHRNHRNPQPAWCLIEVNDESKNNKEAGQKPPGNVAFRDPRTSTTELHQKNGHSNTKPFAESAITAHRQRVSIADSLSRRESNSYCFTLDPDRLIAQIPLVRGY